MRLYDEAHLSAVLPESKKDGGGNRSFGGVEEDQAMARDQIRAKPRTRLRDSRTGNFDRS
jgi:hypothetical protein